MQKVGIQQAKRLVSQWIEEEGFTTKSIKDPKNIAWGYTIQFPPGVPPQAVVFITVVAEKRRRDSVIISCGTTVSPDHSIAMARWDDKKRKKFIYEILQLFHSKGVHFRAQWPEGVLQGFGVARRILFEDLTKSQFLAEVQLIFDIRSLVVLKINYETGTMGLQQQPPPGRPDHPEEGPSASMYG
ncbi:MAG: DUF2299 family protein [Candidatus Hodarchaeota archaeon]